MLSSLGGVGQSLFSSLAGHLAVSPLSRALVGHNFLVTSDRASTHKIILQLLRLFKLSMLGVSISLVIGESSHVSSFSYVTEVLIYETHTDALNSSRSPNAPHP